LIDYYSSAKYRVSVRNIGAHANLPTFGSFRYK
jgi:hypothetical protein